MLLKVLIMGSVRKELDLQVVGLICSWLPGGFAFGVSLSESFWVWQPMPIQSLWGYTFALMLLNSWGTCQSFQLQNVCGINSGKFPDQIAGRTHVDVGVHFLTITC